MFSRFSIQRYASNWFDCFIVSPFGAKPGKYYSKKKACQINAVVKRKDGNGVGILCDQGEAATTSNLSEYTI